MTEQKGITVLACKCSFCKKPIVFLRKEQQKEAVEKHLALCEAYKSELKVAKLKQDNPELFVIFRDSALEDELRKWMKKRHLTVEKVQEYLERLDLNEEE